MKHHRHSSSRHPQIHHIRLKIMNYKTLRFSILHLLLWTKHAISFAPKSFRVLNQQGYDGVSFAQVYDARSSRIVLPLNAINEEVEALDTMIKEDPVFDVQTTISLIAGQSLLVIVAVIAAKFLNVANLGLGTGFDISRESVQNGALLTLPLFFIAFILDQFEKKVPALEDVSKATQRSVLAVLGGEFKLLNAVAVCTALGAAAGVGEEMLFRGVLQDVLVEKIGDNFALVSSALIFGALHAVTPLYAFLAALASLYFGELFIQYNNLAVPIVCHALYDVGALYFAHVTVCNMSREERISLANWSPPPTKASSTDSITK
jgi:membrane protease YdiL (CAAX protease family)